MNDAEQLDIQTVLNLLPHRYPFLLVDRVLECVSGSHITALKNVSVNEPFFPGHFPGKPVMPGVLIVEAMAQATGLLAYVTSNSSAATDLYYLAGVDDVRFRRPVVPGDQLLLKCRLERHRRGVWRFTGTGEVDGHTVATASLLAAKGQ